MGYRLIYLVGVLLRGLFGSCFGNIHGWTWLEHGREWRSILHGMVYGFQMVDTVSEIRSWFSMSVFRELGKYDTLLLAVSLNNNNIAALICNQS